MHLRTFLKPLSFLPAILIMYMIFSFSAQNGEVSSSVSYRVSYTIVKAADRILDAGLEEWQIQDYAVRYNGVTRKIAHMFEYFVLAIAVSFPLYVYGLHGIALTLLAGLICVAFAGTDEYHQAFVGGRAASVKDVAIDSFGVFWGIILVRIIGWTGRHTIFRPIRKQSSVSAPEARRLREEQEELRLEQQAIRRSERSLRKEQKQQRDARSYDQYYGPDARAYDQNYGPDSKGRAPEDDQPSSDTLSDDMPLAGLFGGKRRR